MASQVKRRALDGGTSEFVVSDTMTSKTRAGILTCLTGAGLGLLVLGGGGRAAMHAIARITTGTGDFTLGGTVTVVFLGAVSGAVGGVLLFLSRLLFHQWPPLPTVAFWGGLAALTLRGLRPIDPLRLALFLPVVVAFGLVLQGVTWRWRRGSPAPSGG